MHLEVRYFFVRIPNRCDIFLHCGVKYRHSVLHPPPVLLSFSILSAGVTVGQTSSPPSFSVPGLLSDKAPILLHSLSLRLPSDKLSILFSLSSFMYHSHRHLYAVSICCFYHFWVKGFCWAQVYSRNENGNQTGTCCCLIYSHRCRFSAAVWVYYRSKWKWGSWYSISLCCVCFLRRRHWPEKHRVKYPPQQGWMDWFIFLTEWTERINMLSAKQTYLVWAHIGKPKIQTVLPISSHLSCLRGWDVLFLWKRVKVFPPTLLHVILSVLRLWFPLTKSSLPIKNSILTGPPSGIPALV